MRSFVKFALSQSGANCSKGIPQGFTKPTHQNDCKKGNDSYQNLLLLSLQGLAIVNSEDMPA